MIKIGPDKMDPFPHSVGSCPVCGGCSFTRDCFLCRSVGRVEILYDLRLQTVPYLGVLLGRGAEDGTEGGAERKAENLI